MAGLTDRPEVSRLEVVDTGRRRRWTEEEKLRIVTESLSGPRLGSVTARRYVVVPERPTVSPPSSRMEIVASNGRRVVVDAGVDVAALARVLDVLERR